MQGDREASARTKRKRRGAFASVAHVGTLSRAGVTACVAMDAVQRTRFRYWLTRVERDREALTGEAGLCQRLCRKLNLSMSY